MGYDSDMGRAMVREEENDRSSGLRMDMERLAAELASIEDYLARLKKRLDPILVGEPSSPPIAEGGVRSIDEVGSRSELRAQIQGLVRTASRTSEKINTLIGRVDL